MVALPWTSIKEEMGIKAHLWLGMKEKKSELLARMLESLIRVAANSVTWAELCFDRKDGKMILQGLAARVL